LDQKKLNSLPLVVGPAPAMPGSFVSPGNHQKNHLVCNFRLDLLLIWIENDVSPRGGAFSEAAKHAGNMMEAK